MSIVRYNYSFSHRAMDRGWILIQFLLFIIICLLLSEPYLLAGQQNTIGEITYIKGEVLVRRTDREKFEPAYVGQILYEGYIIETKQNSQVTILCPDGSNVNLRENTLLIFKAISGSATYKTGSEMRDPSKINKFEWFQLLPKPKDPEWASGPPETNILKSSDPGLKKIRDNEQDRKELKKEDRKIEKKEKRNIEKKKEKERS